MLGEKKLHFMHIPKTGGVTFSNYLDCQFKANEICPAIYINTPPTLNWITEKHVFSKLKLITAIDQYKFYKGHLGWIPRTLFSDEMMETITFLRDPLERILSTFGHISRDTYTFPKMSKHWQNFEEFIHDPNIADYLFNQQAQCFCADWYTLSEAAPDPVLSEIIGVPPLKLKLSHTEMIDLALERLHQCAFVGINEQYSKSFKDICSKYQWYFPSKLQKENATRNRIQKSDLSKKSIDRVMELNQIDYLLYQEALKIHNDQSKTSINIAHQFENKKPYANLVVSEKIQFSFDNILIGEGWHPREGLLSVPFCWTSGSISKLLFSMNINADFYRLKIVIDNCLFSGIDNQLTLLINNKTIDFFSYKYKLKIILIGIINKDRLIENPILELTFKLPILTRPCDVDSQSLDVRQLGFACSFVEIKPIDFVTSYLFKLILIFNKILKRYLKLKLFNK